MTLISWCLDCGTNTEFDHIPGAADADYSCRTCGAAVFVEEAHPADELLLPAVVA